MAAFDNFDFELSGLYSCHDAALVLFQTIPDVPVKKMTKSEILTNSFPNLKLLPCQKIPNFYTDKSLKLSDNFNPEDTLFESTEVIEKRQTLESLISFLKNSWLPSDSTNIPTWAGINSLLSEKESPLMHTAFLPFIPHPITEQSTVYTSMENFVAVLDQLEQEFLPVYADEGVFRIMLNI